MVSMWTPCGFYLDTTLLPHGHHMVSMWIPCDFHVHSMSFSGGHYMFSNVDTTWFPGKHYMVSTGCHIVSTWTPYGVQETIWKPALKIALY